MIEKPEMVPTAENHLHVLFKEITELCGTLLNVLPVVHKTSGLLNKLRVNTTEPMPAITCTIQATFQQH